MKKCTRCKENKKNIEFGKRASNKDGLDSRCLKCIAECSKISADKNRAKPAPTIASKVCNSCRDEKDVGAFGTNSGTKDGLRNECRKCRNLKSRARYKSDSDFRLKESLRHAQIYQNNKDRILNRAKQWSKNNPEKKLEQRHRRIARLYGQSEFDLPPGYISFLKEEQQNRCAYCSHETESLTVEHVLPLSRGGKHRLDNIVLACQICNFSKHTKTVQEWLDHNRALQASGITSDTLSIICSNLKIIVESGTKTHNFNCLESANPKATT